jgi:DNA mismatch repair protein MutL
VFANGRRIQDYSLMLAMEYGTQGWFPNGTHPLGAIYIDIDPALADFNIHPAKREARFRDPGAISHAISAGLRDFSRRFNIKVGSRDQELVKSEKGTVNSGRYSDYSVAPGLYPDTSNNNPRSLGPGPRSHSLAMEALLDNPPAFAPLPGHATETDSPIPYSPLPTPHSPFQTAAEESPIYGEPQYAGRIFGIFILIEWGNKLFIIDQHAAHERILYNRFLSEPFPRQELLVPVLFNTESAEDDRFLEAKLEELALLSIVIAREGSSWRIDALPAGWHMSDGETVKKILDLRNAGENMAERWAATVCCHAAVRDGDCLDGASALALAKEALALPDPRCPHGRPVWTEISREALFKAVRRS